MQIQKTTLVAMAVVCLAAISTGAAHAGDTGGGGIPPFPVQSTTSSQLANQTGSDAIMQTSEADAETTVVSKLYGTFTVFLTTVINPAWENVLTFSYDWMESNSDSAIESKSINEHPW